MSLSDKPNILFIVADDLNSWIGALGRHPGSHTPNIDHLARNGVLFSKAYCNAPYCNASRMAVFTGCLPSTNGVYQNEPFWEQQYRRETYIERFRTSGYKCAGSGKVFHGGFDYATAGREKSEWAKWIEYSDRKEIWDGFVSNEKEPMPSNRPLNKMFDFDNFEELSPWNHHFDWGPISDEIAKEMPDQKAADTAIKFLNEDHKNPFLFALGLYKPHLPWYVPQRFFDLHPIDKITVPLVLEDDLDDVPEIARDWALSPPDHETILKHHQWKYAVQGYLASISYCDHLIGLVLNELNSSKYSDNTIVVLWGDNGFHLGEKLHWRKFVLWEEATQVPLIIFSPKGNFELPIIDTPVSLVDLFPTLADLCSINDIEDVDGRSLVPLMERKDGNNQCAAVTTWQKGNHSVRLGNWRYTKYHTGEEELYNHSSDPHEWNNLAHFGRFKSECQRLANYLPSDL